jgi:protein CpxP
MDFRNRYFERVCAGLVLGAAFAAVPARAQTDPPPPTAGTQTQAMPPNGGGFRGGPERRVQMLQHELNLTPDQATQVRSILTGERSKMDAIRSNTTSSAADRRAQMLAIRQEEDIKIHGVLTTDQAAKFDGLEARMRSHREGNANGPGTSPDGPPPPPSGTPPQL